MTDDPPPDGGLAAQIDRVLRELHALRSSDPAATRSLHAVRLAEHTLRCHARPLAGDD